jgi:hypothetical protein
MAQHGDINNSEHETTSVAAKRVKIYGWDPDSLAYVRLVCDSNGYLATGKLSDQYKISDEDASSPAYYGYVRNDGAWYIMKATVTADVTAYRYAKGASGYTTNWTNRAGLTYNYYNVEF